MGNGDNLLDMFVRMTWPISFLPARMAHHRKMPSRFQQDYTTVFVRRSSDGQPFSFDYGLILDIFEVKCLHSSTRFTSLTTKCHFIIFKGH